MINASSKPFNQINFSGVPQMQGAFTGWMQPLVFNKIIKVIENFEVKETTQNILFSGVWQPMGPEVLRLKPEGERSWSWFTCHSPTNINLQTDDVIRFRDVQYRVKQKYDYSLYGYYQWDLVQDYTGAGPEVEAGTP